MNAHPARGLLALVFLVSLFAGCIGDDEANPGSSDEGAARAVATRDTGSITGQVITVDLEVLVDVEIGLTNRTGGLELTKTDTKGRYTFNQLLPGQYRIQMTDSCCKITTVTVPVVAGNVSEINLQVQRLTSVELRLPYVKSDAWDGFVACGVAIGGQNTEACSGADSNHDDLHNFNVTEGLVEMVVAMDWQPTSQGVGGEMRLEMVNRGCQGCGERYFLIAGPPPISVSVTNGDIQNHGARFDQINGTMDMRFETAMAGISAGYQQAFTVYWHEFYNDAAPADFNPLPDG